MNTMPITLAITWVEVAFALIMLVSFIGSAIANMNKKAREEEARRQQRAARASGAPGAVAAAPSADDLAAKRRAQLEELARRGGKGQTEGKLAPRQTSALDRPANQTVAAAHQREDAKRMHDQRDEPFRRQGQMAAERAAEQRSAAERAAARQREFAEQQRQRQLAEARRRARQAEAVGRPAGRAPSGARATQRTAAAAALVVLEPVDEPTVLSGDIAATDISDAAANAYAERSKVRRGLVLDLSPKALRAAMVLKEVLDHPVALRRPGGPYDSNV